METIILKFAASTRATGMRISTAEVLTWINPENEKFWHSGDCEMAAYDPLCNEVRHVENLNQLAAFIREIVL